MDDASDVRYRKVNYEQLARAEAVEFEAAVCTEQETKAVVLQDANSGHLSPIPVAETEALVDQLGYDKLDAAGTRQEYLNLKAEIDQRVGKVAECKITLDEAAVYFRRMQALLSQRGADRKKVLREAGCPEWTPFALEFAKKVGRSVRQLRRISNAVFGTPEGKGGKSNPTPRWNKAARRAAIEGCQTLNDIATAYEAGKDISPLVAKAKTAISRERFNDIINAHSTEPDYHRMLIELLDAILSMPFGDAKLWVGVRETAKDMKKAIMTGQRSMQTGKIPAGKAVKGQETVGPVSAKPAARWYCAPARGRLMAM